MTLLLISFLAGVLTVLAPCILPLLPVIVGGSLTGEKIHRNKALTVVLSLGASVIIFTLLLKVSTVFINIPQSLWMWISGGIIVLFGIVTVFPNLLNLSKLNMASNKVMTDGMKKNSIWGDIIIGASLGPVFSTCSPTYFIILATVLPQSFLTGSIYLLSYTIGLCISLFIISFVGQKIIEKLGVAADTNGWFKKTLGIIFILVGLAIIVGFDKKIESGLLSSGFFDVTKVEQNLLQKPKLKLNLGKAPEFVSPSGYINTDEKPITLAQFKGKKVVLLDIWTYSCINCQRTLPYVKQWYDKYKDQGLVVIGIHTPEFGFEKIQANVEKAVKDLGITYPVILDNNYSTWNAYGNQYWPRKYLIDLDGNIIYDHIGEGDYDKTEMAIQDALNVSKPLTQPSNVITINPNSVGSPELYFGSSRNGSSENSKVNFVGKWNINPEYSENVEPGSIIYTYTAKNVYMVASGENQIEVYVDDAKIKTIDTKAEKLYNLVEGIDYGKHKLSLKILKKGLKAFTFTFG